MSWKKDDRNKTTPITVRVKLWKNKDREETAALLPREAAIAVAEIDSKIRYDWRLINGSHAVLDVLASNTGNREEHVTGLRRGSASLRDRLFHATGQPVINSIHRPVIQVQGNGW